MGLGIVRLDTVTGGGGSGAVDTPMSVGCIHVLGLFIPLIAEYITTPLVYFGGHCFLITCCRMPLGSKDISPIVSSLDSALKRLDAPVGHFALVYISLKTFQDLRYFSLQITRHIIWIHGGNLWWNFQVTPVVRCIWGQAAPNEWAATLTMLTERCRSTRPQHGYIEQEQALRRHALCWRLFEAAMGVNAFKFLEFLFLPASLH